ncbi:MAG: hypothetical protein RIG77_15585 [Cyclobacteriaceae bacterium]
MTRVGPDNGGVMVLNMLVANWIATHLAFKNQQTCPYDTNEQVFLITFDALLQPLLRGKKLSLFPAATSFCKGFSKIHTVPPPVEEGNKLIKVAVVLN